MRVLLAHALTPERRRLARVLRAAGHDVVEIAEPDAALECCRAWGPDVALIHVDCCGGLVGELKSDLDVSATAFVRSGRRGVDRVGALGGMRSGVQDSLVDPGADG